MKNIISVILLLTLLIQQITGSFFCEYGRGGDTIFSYNNWGYDTNCSEEVIELSKKIIADKETESAKASAIIKWCWKNIHYDYIRALRIAADKDSFYNYKYGNRCIYLVNPDEIIERKKGFCLEQVIVAVVLLSEQEIECYVAINKENHAVLVVCINEIWYNVDMTRQEISKSIEDLVICV